MYLSDFAFSAFRDIDSRLYVAGSKPLRPACVEDLQRLYESGELNELHDDSFVIASAPRGIKFMRGGKTAEFNRRYQDTFEGRGIKLNSILQFFLQGVMTRCMS